MGPGITTVAKETKKPVMTRASSEKGRVREVKAA
jgi:hypothetical protein